MSKKKGKVLIGTSGWHYASWRGPFFPSGLMVKHQLQFYASQFETTELNGVFYRTPTEATVRNWRNQTAANFIFAWKASKYITHWKRLSERSADSLELMEERIALLGDKAGPILFQLPPNFTAAPERLQHFLKMLSPRHRYVFEFRHRSWYAAEIFRLLAKHNVALCISDHHDAPSPWEQTADFVYVRGHGPGGRYRGHYSGATLNRWSEQIDRWRSAGSDVFVYFDNDQKSAAPLDAAKLRAMQIGL
ncbi:hypothetical protein AFEL58S_00937 [Afipia felis]